MQSPCNLWGVRTSDQHFGSCVETTITILWQNYANNGQEWLYILENKASILALCTPDSQFAWLHFIARRRLAIHIEVNTMMWSRTGWCHYDKTSERVWHYKWQMDYMYACTFRCECGIIEHTVTCMCRMMWWAFILSFILGLMRLWAWMKLRTLAFMTSYDGNAH